ncbi:HNH endonuclease signature motif containing protein [Microbacterium alcoholitolerans]|uniref:HNH endonuclease signature motif containing protein n=1 Tax=unclassified Microbacterium TaxID=2609290 RepID=UPI003D16C26A
MTDHRSRRGWRSGPSDDETSVDETNADDEFNSDPRNVLDTRTRGQKQHDALAAALGIAARHAETPSLGGAAPTLVVHLESSDSSWASIPGVGGPVSAAVARHTGCTGAIQRVFTDEGRIVGMTVSDRIFTVYQRRAIVLRDKECLIPGCHVPASWCEIHHVTEYARGGPTSTDNGVPLCWWHHRSLEYSGWEIRMNEGLPEIRGPAWWDPQQSWRTPRLSLPDVACEARGSALATRRRAVK